MLRALPDSVAASPLSLSLSLPARKETRAKEEAPEKDPTYFAGECVQQAGGGGDGMCMWIGDVGEGGDVARAQGRCEYTHVYIIDT